MWAWVDWGSVGSLGLDLWMLTCPWMLILLTSEAGVIPWKFTTFLSQVERDCPMADVDSARNFSFLVCYANLPSWPQVLGAHLHSTTTVTELLGAYWGFKWWTRSSWSLPSRSSERAGRVSRLGQYRVSQHRKRNCLEPRQCSYVCCFFFKLNVFFLFILTTALWYREEHPRSAS